MVKWLKSQFRLHSRKWQYCFEEWRLHFKMTCAAPLFIEIKLRICYEIVGRYLPKYLSTIYLCSTSSWLELLRKLWVYLLQVGCKRNMAFDYEAGDGSPHAPGSQGCIDIRQVRLARHPTQQPAQFSRTSSVWKHHQQVIPIAVQRQPQRWSLQVGKEGVLQYRIVTHIRHLTKIKLVSLYAHNESQLRKLLSICDVCEKFDADILIICRWCDDGSIMVICYGDA